MLRWGPLFRPAVSAAVSRRLLFRTAVLAIGALMVFPALALASAPITARAWADDHLVITSDNSGRPLVSGANLAPGATPPSCLSISYTGAATDDELRLFSTTTDSGLADYLDITIEQGQGGRYGDCSGFTGTGVYEGTLAAFGREHGSELTALPIARLAAGQGEVSVRFTFAIRDDNRAQGASTTSDFTWIAGPAVSAPPGNGSPGEEPQPEPDSAVTVPVIGSPSPAPAPSANPSANASANPSADPSANPSNKVVERSDGERHQAVTDQVKEVLGSAIQRFQDQLRRIAKPLLKGAAFGLGTLPLVLLYLLIQGRIDRGDPKLAKAPSYADPDLVFGDMPQAVG